MTPIDYRRELESTPPAPQRGRLASMFAGLAVVVLLGLMVGLRWYFDRPQPPANVRPVAFEIRLAETMPGPSLTAATLNDGVSPRTVYLHSESVVTNVHVESAEVVEESGGPAIQFALDAVGTRQMMQATAAHRGKPLAILIDGQVRMAPTVNSQIGGKGILSGTLSEAEAERIALGIAVR